MFKKVYLQTFWSTHKLPIIANAIIIIGNLGIAGLEWWNGNGLSALNFLFLAIIAGMITMTFYHRFVISVHRFALRNERMKVALYESQYGEINEATKTFYGVY